MVVPSHRRGPVESSSSRWVMVALAMALFLLGPAAANYRHFHLDNADICNSDRFSTESKPLVIGSGAAIIELSSPSTKFHPDYNKAKRCEIHIKSPDKDHGLMAYVERLNMRRSSKDSKCVDYLQFGSNDLVPFFTIKKSERYCGAYDGRASVSRGVSFDEPNGDLLVWVSLGGRRQTSYWPIISVVNLTLIVTTYQKDCSRPKQNYRRCSDRSRCIYQNYFCDRHFNCLTDKIPLDEDGCQYEQFDDGKASNATVDGGSSGMEEGFGLNSVTKTLVIVCSTLGILLFLILWLRYSKRKRCCPCGAPAEGRGGNGEQPPRSLDELNRLRQLRGGQENIYMAAPSSAAVGRSFQRRPDEESDTFIVDPSRGAVVTHVVGGGGGTGSHQTVAGPPNGAQWGGPPPREEAPPAYEELYPDRAQEAAAVGGSTEPPAASSSND